MNAHASTRAPKDLSPAVTDLVSEGGHALASDDSRVDTPRCTYDIAKLAGRIRKRLMAQYSIVFDGVQYERDGYRYGELGDAVRYARIQRILGKPDVARKRQSEQIEKPNDAQLLLMVSLRITYRDGAYHLGSYRYERLCDAIAYAQLKRE